MSTLFLVLAKYPHIQERAQTELDSVIGRDRLPEYDDRPRLPYIEAICKELLRWKMAAPLGRSITLSKLASVSTNGDVGKVSGMPRLKMMSTKGTSSRKAQSF